MSSDATLAAEVEALAEFYDEHPAEVVGRDQVANRLRDLLDRFAKEKR